MQDLQTTLPIGTIIQDRYIVENLLGRGGFGAVYLVRDLRVKGNLFALKEVIDPDKRERERFTFECEVLKRFDHHALPKVYRTFEDDVHGRTYMLMDYIEGANLEEVRQRQPEKRLLLVPALRMMAPIFQAVSYLHKQRPPIIHRDIKPANIIAPKEGESSVLVDLGIAKEYDQDSTTTAVRRCSPGYGAPEQYARGTNPRTDIYGLGATLYALLTGNVPADALYRMTQQSSKHVDPLEPIKQIIPTIPAAVSDAIERAMSLNSQERFVSVDEFWQALTAGREADLLAPALPPPVVSQRQVATPSQNAAHRLPTDKESGIESVTTAQVAKRSRKGRRLSGLLLLFTSLALLALAAGLTFGTGLLFNRSGSSAASPKPGPSATTATTPAVTATNVAKATSTAQVKATSTPPPAKTVTPPMQPTASARGYPKLVSTYQGSITNQSTTPYTNDGMFIQMQQPGGGAAINGALDLTGNLQGDGNFSGNVTTNNQIQFLVQGYAGHLPLLFWGTIGKNGALQGKYCSARGAGSSPADCDYSYGGYGEWRVAPMKSGS